MGRHTPPQGPFPKLRVCPQPSPQPPCPPGAPTLPRSHWDITSQKALQGSQRLTRAVPDAGGDPAAQEGPDVCRDGGEGVVSMQDPPWTALSSRASQGSCRKHCPHPKPHPTAVCWSPGNRAVPAQHPQPPPFPNPPHGSRKVPLSPCTLTLQAVIGVAQRDVAAVDDEADLLQGQRWGIGAGWGLLGDPSPLRAPGLPSPRAPLGLQTCLGDGEQVGAEVAHGAVDVGEGAAHGLREAAVADEGARIAGPAGKRRWGSAGGAPTRRSRPDSPNAGAERAAEHRSEGPDGTCVGTRPAPNPAPPAAGRLRHAEPRCEAAGKGSAPRALSPTAAASSPLSLRAGAAPAKNGSFLARPSRPPRHSQQERRQQQHSAVQHPASAARPPALFLGRASPAAPAAAAAAEAASRQRHHDDEEQPDGDAHQEAQLVTQQL